MPSSSDSGLPRAGNRLDAWVAFDSMPPEAILEVVDTDRREIGPAPATVRSTDPAGPG